MTMHLERTLTALNTRRRKQKITRRQLEQYIDDHLAYNRRMKRQGRHDERLSLEAYIDQRHGRVKVSAPDRDYHPRVTYMRETPAIPSLDTGAHNTSAPVRQEYTGTLVKGIATMHKSNAVPVIDQEQAKDIARMRRG